MGILSSLPVLGNWRVGMGEDAFLRALQPRELLCLEARQRPSRSGSGPRVCVPPAPHLGSSHQKPQWFCSMPGSVCKGKGSGCVFRGNTSASPKESEGFLLSPAPSQGPAHLPLPRDGLSASPCSCHRAPAIGTTLWQSPSEDIQIACPQHVKKSTSVCWYSAFQSSQQGNVSGVDFSPPPLNITDLFIFFPSY